jgi:hypothetical protein
VSATLAADGVPLAGRRVIFFIGSAEAPAVTGRRRRRRDDRRPHGARWGDRAERDFSGEMTDAATLLGPGSGYAGSRDEVGFEVD